VLRTYCGRFSGRCRVSRDVIGVAHREERIDSAVLVSSDRVDDRVPIAKFKKKTPLIPPPKEMQI
jgi:hypothetical protein